MKSSLIRWSAACVMLAAMAGCGGGGGGGAAAPALPANQVIASASAIASNDTAINSSAPFTVLQNAGVPAVTVNSPPVVNFTVFSDGAVKTGLTTANVRFAIAKLVPGINGEPDQWVNYISKNVTGIAPAKLASAPQATTDTATPKQLVYNPDGYYTYTFTTDITAIAGIAYEPNLTHRVAIQLSYKNAAGEVVKVNPYFDFTLVNGKSVAVTDPNKTRKMTDVSSCNGCHEKLALHGGGRVDTQYCVMCHNPGTIDPESGNVLTLSTMVHKIHAGKLLYSQLAKGGEDYTIWGYENKKYSYAEVGFPQDLRNCSVCHSGANPKTPQGDNWKTEASKGACLTCHASNSGSVWDTNHQPYAAILMKDPAAKALNLVDGYCLSCHSASSKVSPERVHWNQNEENAAKYKMNIESAEYDAATRNVTVKYYLSDPTNGDKAYKLLADKSDCTPNTDRDTLKDCNYTKFGNLKFYLAYQNMIGQSTATTEYSAFNNGGNSAVACLYEGPTTTACKLTAVNNGSDHYTVTIPVPADKDTAKAFGTARVVGVGQIKETAFNVQTREPVSTVIKDSNDVEIKNFAGKAILTQANVVVQHSFRDLALSGSLQPRRLIVSNEKCNVCHGALGTTSGSNTLANAFHGGARNTVEACVVCHDANRVSSTVMTDGSSLNESYQFKRMIHGIHGNSRRTYPFTHGNPAKGVFDKTGKLTANGSFLADQKVTIGGVSTTVVAAGTVIPAGSTFQTIADIVTAAAGSVGYTGAAIAPAENYAAEVAYPGVGLNCNACHVNDSYKQDLGTLGAVVNKPIIAPATTATTNPNLWKVISPKVATCTACHDSAKAIEHVTLNIGDPGAVFGTRTQADLLGLPAETCNDCHAVGARQAVDLVHGQK